MTTEAKPAANGAAPVDPAKRFEKEWAGKLCPYLTSAGLRAGGPSLIGPQGGAVGGGQMEAMSCQGPQCMLFIVYADQTGAPAGCGCAIALLPTAIGQIANTNAGIAQKFIGNYKIIPRT